MTTYSAHIELTGDGKTNRQNEMENFFWGVIDSVKGTVSGIGTAIETIYIVTFGDSKQRQEGGRRIREFTDGVQYLVAHPIKSLESFGEYIKSVAAEEGTSYVVGYGGGELLQFVAGGAAAKAATSAGKAAKATKAVDKVADAGKARTVIITSNLGRKIDITPGNYHYISVNNPGITGIANSSVDIVDDVGNIVTRRWYDSEGKVYRDVDMTNHGNAKKHQEYPHEHFWNWSDDIPQRGK